MKLRHPPQVLVVGPSSPTADCVAEVLRPNGISADWADEVRFPRIIRMLNFDVIYLQICSRLMLVGKQLGKKTSIHFVGNGA